MSSILQQAIDALEEAQNGLAWYREQNPDQSDGSDDEAALRIEHALHNLRAAQKVTLPPPVQYSVTCNGRHVNNAFDTARQAEDFKRKMDADYPGHEREIVPMHTANQLCLALAAAGGGMPQEVVLVDGVRYSVPIPVAAEFASMMDQLASSPQPEAEPSEAEQVCMEAYQVVGSLLSDLGAFETDEAEKILDNLCAMKRLHKDVLPWPSFAKPEAAPAVAQVPRHFDEGYVDRFAQAMKDKLAAARAKGRYGWQACPPEELSRMLREHVEKGDPRDVANFCMFLWSLGHGITTPEAPAQAAQWNPPPLTCSRSNRSDCALFGASIRVNSAKGSDHG